MTAAVFIFIVLLPGHQK